MADEQNTPSDASNTNETTPIEPVTNANQGPAEVSAPVAAPEDGRSPWVRRGLVAAGVVGLMAISGIAGFAIGQESDDRDSSDQLMAQRGPMGDGERGYGHHSDGHRYGHHGDGERGYGHHGYGDGPMGGPNGMDNMPGMPQRGQDFGRDQMPGMGEMPTPQQMLEWLQDQGVDMEQFMQEFSPGGMGQGMRPSS